MDVLNLTNGGGSIACSPTPKASAILCVPAVQLSVSMPCQNQHCPLRSLVLVLVLVLALVLVLVLVLLVFDPLLSTACDWRCQSRLIVVVNVPD